MDKSKAAYDNAYQIITATLFPLFQNGISPASRYKPEIYFQANFEIIQRLEELRYVYLNWR
jgi:hypothetical protein